MKNAALFSVALLVATIASPALAEDHVSQDALSALGLGGMNKVSDERGHEVRGQQSAFAMAVGTGLVFGQLITPDTKNFLAGSDVNMVNANQESTDALAVVIAAKEHFSFVNLDLDVNSGASPQYTGNAVGFTGGAGIAEGGQFSFPLGITVP